MHNNECVLCFILAYVFLVSLFFVKLCGPLCPINNRFHDQHFSVNISYILCVLCIWECAEICTQLRRHITSGFQIKEADVKQLMVRFVGKIIIMMSITEF